MPGRFSCCEVCDRSPYCGNDCGSCDPDIESLEQAVQPIKPRPWTLAEARYILSHVYCVHCLPEDDGWIYPWSIGAGEALCCRCPCREPANLRLYVATERKAREWLEKENARQP